MTITGRYATGVLIALAVSLFVNVAVVGTFAYDRYFRDRYRGFAPERLVSLGARSMPESLRASIVSHLRDRKDDLRSGFRDVREARRQVYDAMRAEPYDRAAVEAAFANLRQRLGAVAGVGQEAILQALDKSSEAERSGIQPPPAIDRQANDR